MLTNSILILKRSLFTNTHAQIRKQIRNLTDLKPTVNFNNNIKKYLGHKNVKDSVKYDLIRITKLLHKSHKKYTISMHNPKVIMDL